MNRQQKEQVVQELASGFQAENPLFLVNYKGMTVAQMADLRKKLREQGGKMQVAKVTLVRRAIDQAQSAVPLKGLLTGQLAVVFAQKEATSVAKTLCNFAKEHEQLNVIGGCYESELLSKDQVVRFASLPSREVLLAQVCGTLQAPIAKLAATLYALLSSPVRVVKQLELKKASE